MKVWIFLLISLCNSAFAVDYEQELSPDYHTALEYLEKNQTVFDESLGDHDPRKTILVSVVFPEIVRYSFVRDLLETKSLEIGYVRKGSRFVDFSIGRFQMKPSFLESLESYIQQNPQLQDKYHPKLRYATRDQQSIRRERIERLRSLNWQLLYLQVFYEIVLLRHPFLQEKSLDYRIRFIATAYNHGFLAGRVELEQWMDRKTYPWGAGIKGEQYAYSRVAQYFFIRHYHSIF